MKTLDLKVHLKESKLTSPYEFFHKLTENFVLFRWVYFKNRPRSTFLLLRSLLVNSFIFGAYYLVFSNINFIFLGVEVAPVLLFAGSVSFGYWVMSWSFSQKANYLSSMYNDLVKVQAQNHPSWKILACNFTAQLLIMDFWGHRLYSWVFTNTLLEAAAWNIENNKSTFKSVEEFVDYTNVGKLEVGVARNMVLSYQQHLLSQINSEHSHKNVLKAS
jgi:hypothetical protein